MPHNRSSLLWEVDGEGEMIMDQPLQLKLFTTRYLEREEASEIE